MRIFLMFVFLFLPLSAFAQSIVINEIAWMGTPVVGVEEKQWWRYEWLELYNTKVEPLQIDGWSVELYRGEELYFEIPLVGTVPSMGYFLVGASDKISGVDVNYANLGGKLLNTGMRVLLKDNVGTIVDDVDSVRSLASNSWPAGDNITKQTMESSVQGWQTSKESGGTPKAPNSEGTAKEIVTNSVISDSALVKPSYPLFGLAKDEATGQTKPSLVNNEIEKDLSGSSSFQSRVPIVSPITLLAGFLALGFSGVLLLVKRSLALRQKNRET